jgi:hypothetical protein
MPRTKKRDFDAMARMFLLNGEKKIGEAMIAGGYPRSSAQRGIASMCHGDRDKFRAAVEKKKLKMLGEYAYLGEVLTPEQQLSFVRGKLIDNALSGEDRAPQSLKMLGQDKRANMFAPESTAGYFILQLPPDFDRGIRPCPTPESPNRFEYRPTTYRDKALPEGKEQG